MVRGAGCVGDQEKEGIGYFLDDVRAFGINADQWTTATQDEGESRSRARDGKFHGEGDRCRESQGWTTKCCGLPERDGKDQVENSPKASGLVLVRSPSLTSHKWRERVARTCILRAFGLQMPCRLSLVLRLFCFGSFSSLCFR